MIFIMEDNILDLKNKIEELTWQLNEANDTIEAIRTGQVDALIVKDNSGSQVYTLKSADQTYRVFIEKMREGAVTLSEKGIVLYSNSSFANMLHLPLESVIGSRFTDFLHTKDVEVFEALAKKGWQTDSKGETHLLVEKTVRIPVLLSLTTLEFDDGIALSVIITDLSLLKTAEKELQEKNRELVTTQNALTILNDQLENRVIERTNELLLSREHFRFLADNIPVIAWTAKPDGKIDYFNKKWYRFTNFSEEESLAFGWQKAIHPDDLAPSVLSWMEAVKTGKDYYTEYRFQRASDGLYRSHLCTGIPFKNSTGNITKWFGVCVDIEDQKAAMTRKDEFISMASHELKTPLTIIKAFSQILFNTLEKGNNLKALEYVNNLEKQINRLNKLITDLLDATKANEGEMIFEKNVFDFNTLVNEVVAQVQLTTVTHTIELQLAETLQITADRSRLSQVIINLLSNAIKYSPYANKVTITSSVSGPNVKLCVKDYGIGIPVSQQPKLFSRFFRASEVKTNTFPGLGLGLYISNEIIKRHNGLLTFTSEENKGSIFCIELPLGK